ncbi:tyrosine-type recombinase/integrase [Mesorhizobium sp. B2-8-5]|uniref:tyrosine-type recombinase/integrase n=1 Tax=Mesorhizobium sp. B2-8-5 TaxID=2589903 RepID=UPI00112658FB|nr:tyrosine-type recombinase/integrase [Mesorhizobium sp. B2-8-5]UCI28017.1 tyrosine-type recombinase/integrase [Mesorhizobium sp. B2-8-5]
MRWVTHHHDAAARGRAAWNAGKTVGTKRPLTQKQIWATRFFLDRDGRIATHSLRRTQAAMIYKATGNVRAIQILLGHTKIENTVRYLGVYIEDALLLAERTGI